MILRSISKALEGVQTNTDLGRKYNYVNKHLHPNEFAKWMESVGHEIYELDSVFGLVIYDQGSAYEILRDNEEHYIISESGRTIDRLRNYGKKSSKTYEQ